jgi:hypothetical protein
LINLWRRIAEGGRALGPPIVKGGTPREARREKRTLKEVDPCDRTQARVWHPYLEGAFLKLLTRVGS